MDDDLIKKAQELFREDKEFEAISLLRPLSESGDPVAKANLGLFLAYAETEKDIELAASLLGEACEAGEASACHNLGTLWLGNSPSIGSDSRKAARYFLRARELGGPIADESFYKRWEEELSS